MLSQQSLDIIDTADQFMPPMEYHHNAERQAQDQLAQIRTIHDTIKPIHHVAPIES
ncbi:hypothetical protein D3C75_1091480 [compost metagenome]